MGKRTDPPPPRKTKLLEHLEDLLESVTGALESLLNPEPVLVPVRTRPRPHVRRR